MMGNVITASLGFLTFFVLVRSIEQDPFGEWVLFITAATLIDLLRFGITRVGLTRFLSGAKPDERKHFIGSSWLIGLVSIAVMAFLLYPLVLIFPETIKNSGFNLFFIWYVPLALSNLPWGNATSILQADEEFDKILLVRFINTGSFLLFLVLNYYIWRVSVEWIVIWNILTNVLTSIMCTAFNWDGSWYIFQARRYTTKITLNFGKYSMGTSIGSSLLKSADAFIIGLSPFLGTTGVALYSIPIKFTEAIEIIIRSFGATSFPKLSKFSIEGNIPEFRRVLYQYAGFLTYLLIPIAIISAFFAKDFVIILGGKQYKDVADGLAIVMQMFIIFSLLLPIDRFTGIGLDAINKPDKNFYKTLIMTSTNIVGDLIAVFLVHWLFPSLSMVTILIFISIGSIGFEIMGVVFGFYYLNKEVPLKFFSIFTEGLVVYRDLYQKALEFIRK
ncbi:MAG: oligosaccharide flippase family protein [Bacteroidales bacterium]|nr:oligosaccharide flippase family protein [Bacteroidales bacterium]